jgi:pimeloyl-ACP methyl ester carboxylesterase
MASSIAILIGGLAMRGRELAPLAEALSAHGVTCYMFDNLFAGDAPRPMERMLSIEDQARHQWAELEALGLNFPHVTLFGISMGGMIAATMATLQPGRVQKLILAATSANLATHPAVPDALYQDWVATRTPEDLDRAVSIAFGRTTLTHRPDIKSQYFRYRLKAENGQSPKDFLAQLNSVREFPGEAVYRTLGQQNIPTTLITGEEDDLFPDSHARDILALLPQSRHIALAQTGHMLHLENLNGLVRALIEA